MKLLRNLALTLLAAKVVIFSGLFCGEFLEQDVAEMKSAEAPLSCCISVKTCELLDDNLSNSLIVQYRSCRELKQLFIIFLTNNGTQYSWWNASHLIANSHDLPLTAGIKEVKVISDAEEKKSGFSSRRATQDLAQYWDEEVEEVEEKPAPPLSITIPPVSDGRVRGSSSDWYIGRSPTSPNRGWASPVLVN
ncbi:MAG: hypothetical protein WCJ92_02115 [Alphaproteobacteria bacterium]